VVEKMANLVIGSLSNKDLRDDGHQNRLQKVLAHLQQKGQSSKEQAEGCREIAVIAGIARDRRDRKEKPSEPSPLTLTTDRHH
jgi:hypothetical protein